MCGICGIAYFDANRSADQELLRCMTMGVLGIHLWDELSLRNLPGKTPV